MNSLIEDMATAAELTRIVDRLEERVGDHIKFFWTIVAVGFAWLGAISGTLYLMNGSLVELRSLLAPQRLTKSAAQATNPQAPKQVPQIIEQAKKSNVLIPTDVVADAGRIFATASTKNPDAWSAVTTLMEYRTYLNGLTFLFPSTGMEPEDTHFDLNNVPGKDPPALSFVQQGTPITSAARFQRIGHPTNPKVAIGPVHLIARGGALSLDEMDIAHVIFDGVEVHYSGKQAMLEDVVFVNCTFVFDNSERSRMLAQSVVSSLFVNFGLSG
jgi:hypothetical protein